MARHTARVSWPGRAESFAFFQNEGMPLAFAHRGGTLLAGNAGIENSMAAFGNAVRLGYRYLETDVHATRDGAVVAFHDATLDRVTDGSGTIASLPLADVRQALIGGREPIPLLDELLDSWPEVRLNIDCKALPAIEPLVETIRRHRAEQRVCVASFSERRLRRLRRLLGPGVATSYAAPGVAALRLVPTTAAIRLLAGSGSQVAQVPIGARHFRVVTPAFVSRLHAVGRQVHVWTLDAPELIEQVLDAGADGVMTDRPDVLREVLRSRGQWAGDAA